MSILSPDNHVGMVILKKVQRNSSTDAGNSAYLGGPEGNPQQAVLLGSPADKKALVEVLQRFSKEGTTRVQKMGGKMTRWSVSKICIDLLFGIGKDPI